MPNHVSNDRALRRGRFAAWTVFIIMAGTTMTFQVFHSIRYGHLPWPLAVLYGVVPLLIAMCILEFVSVWYGAPWWARTGSYLIMGGAMYLSAAATGAVVLHAAPAHMSGLFGVLLDAAALLAVHFILNGPRAMAALPGGLPVAPGMASPAAPGEAIAGATGEPSQEPLAEAIREPRQEPERKPRRSAARGPAADPAAVKARAAYRKSQHDGSPLSDRALGEMFGKSRTWGANRIKECETGLHLASKTG